MLTDARDDDAVRGLPRGTSLRAVTQPSGDAGELLRECAAAFTSLSLDALELIRSAMGDRVSKPVWQEFYDAPVSGGLDKAAVPPRGDALAHKLSVRAAQLLFDHWMANPVPALAVDAAFWAAATSQWTKLSALWGGYLIGAGTWRRPEAVELFASLPSQARQDAPLLTLAWAQARANGLRDAAAERQMRRDLLADVTSFHARWREATDLDAILLGASMCMLTYRATPGVDPTSALGLAWEAHDEAAMALERRRAEATESTSEAEVIFRAVSAHNALARGDLGRAVAEAERAAMINPTSSRKIADGAGALARELSGVNDDPIRGRLDAGRGEPIAILDFGSRWDLTVANAAAEKLTVALECVRALDREGCERALAELGELGPGSTMWTIRLFAEGLHAALWGDPAAALTHHDNVRASHSLVSVEHLEPLGHSLLSLSRIAILNRLGAAEAALAAASTLDLEWRPLPEASTRLWAGDFDGARRIAETALQGATVRMGDRPSLRAVRAGSSILDPAVSDSVRTQLVREVFAECFERRSMLPIAILPCDVRSQMLALYLANRGSAEESERESQLQAGLRRVTSTAGTLAAPIPLTRREKTLLPLLATADAVPDIAASLHVSANTVRTQVAILRRKFGAKSRSELVRMARNAGLL